MQISLCENLHMIGCVGELNGNLVSFFFLRTSRHFTFKKGAID